MEKRDGNDIGDLNGNGKKGIGNFESLKNRKWFGPAIKIALVLSIFIVVFYLVYFATKYGKAALYLSNVEINSVPDDGGDKDLNFKLNDKIYFYVEREGKNLESDLIVLDVEFFDKGSYRKFKQISYEIDKNFPKLGAYIPREYFAKSGKYRIKMSLDGKMADQKEFQIQ